MPKSDLASFPPSARRNLARLIAGEAVSYLGDQVATVAIMLLVFQRTGHAAAVAIAVILLQAAPLLLFSPIGGVLADRLPRRALMISTDLLRTLVSLLMAVTSNLIILYLFIFLLGVGRALFTPALRALLPQLVPTEHLARSNALFSTAFNFSLFVGPALGGVIIALFSASTAFLANALSFTISALCIWWIRPQLANSSRTGARSPFSHEVIEGLGILWKQRATRGVVLSLIAVVLAGSIGNIAAVGLAETVFHAGSPGYGLLVSGSGLGILAGGLALSLGPTLQPIDPWLARGIGLMTLSMVAVAFTPLLLVGAVALLLEGVGNALENTATLTIVQTKVPDHQQGRAFGGLYTFASLAAVPALALGGILLEFVPVRLIYLLVAASMGAATLVAWRNVASPLRQRAR